MTSSSRLLPRPKLSSRLRPRLSARLGQSVIVLAGLCALARPAAAQNIDEGKSAPQLYAATCAQCHRNPAALAKGRFRATLASFLQDHYTTGVGEAWALAGYLASVDAGPPRGKPKQAKRPQATSAQPN